MFFWKLSKIKISEGIFIKCFKYCLFNNDLIRECVNIVLISLTEIIFIDLDINIPVCLKQF